MRKLRRFLFRHGIVLYRTWLLDAKVLLLRVLEVDRAVSLEGKDSTEQAQPELPLLAKSEQSGTEPAAASIVPENQKDWFAQTTFKII